MNGYELTTDKDTTQVPVCDITDMLKDGTAFEFTGFRMTTYNGVDVSLPPYKKDILKMIDDTPVNTVVAFVSNDGSAVVTSWVHRWYVVITPTRTRYQDTVVVPGERGLPRWVR